MKEITKERTNIEKYTIYIAVDGTQFNFKEECERYENSAKGVLHGKFSRLIINNQYTEYSLFKCGCDDNTVVVVELPTEADVDTVLQTYYLDNPHYLSESYKALQTRLVDTLLQAYKEKDVVLFSYTCDNDLYFIDSRNNFIRKLNGFTKKKEESENEQLPNDVNE